MEQKNIARNGKWKYAMGNAGNGNVCTGKPAHGHDWLSVSWEPATLSRRQNGKCALCFGFEFTALDALDGYSKLDKYLLNAHINLKRENFTIFIMG